MCDAFRRGGKPGHGRFFWVAILTALVSIGADARILTVGAGREYALPSLAAVAASEGDEVEIEAGRYVGDVAVWNQKALKIRGVHGLVTLVAGGAAAENKAIWLFRDGDFTVENIRFEGARVRDRNGAGIRFEKGRLLVRNCVFVDNENGLLTNNDPASELEIEGSEFAHDGTLDGFAHNLYVGHIKRLRVSASYFHHGRGGQLIKSRASVSEIYFNRLTDEEGGQASYELEFPSGGIAYVVGNQIEQSSTTRNPYIVSYGTEGYRWPKNELYLVNNTLVDDRASGGIFLRVRPGATVAKAVNNVLIGDTPLDHDAKGAFINNPHADWGDVALEPRQDYRLRLDSRLVGKVVDPGVANGVSLRQAQEYVHPRQMRPVKLMNPGGVQNLAP